MMKNHEIDYKIIGEELQCVEIELDPQEAVIAEAGSLMYMDDTIEMKTVFGDASDNETSILDKFLSMPIHLPPLSEQKRIIDRIETIFTSLDMIMGSL